MSAVNVWGTFKIGDFQNTFNMARKHSYNCLFLTSMLKIHGKGCAQYINVNQI